MAITLTQMSEPLTTIFTFKASPTLSPPLSFRRCLHRRSSKRSRPVADVDTLVSSSKKKRRLRLTLITSRLSLPFSTPATHIADPGSSKIAVWAKQRHLAPQALRKAAIMNHVRRRTLERRDSRKDSAISVGEDARQEAKLAVLEELEIQANISTGSSPNAVSSYNDAGHSMPPSPLGLSNYDALDEEDDWYESYEEDNETSTSPRKATEHKNDRCYRTNPVGPYYSDFNFLDRRSPKDDENDDDPFHLGLLPQHIPGEKRPPSPPEDKTVELFRELQRERKITSGFLQFA